jgi:hypothetical protein
MLSTVARTSVRQSAAVRTFASVPSPWGSDTWRYDKNSFLAWCTEATSKKDSAARRELYGMLAMRFGDTDVDKDGKINAAEFDGLCEDVASLPRRFGLAPSWEKEYGTVERRTASRKAMFDMLDLRQGPPRGWIGLEQFVNWATDHLITKVATIDINADVDYYHIEQYGEHQYLSHLEEAVSNPSSRAHASLYEFLLAIFTECDSRSTGVLTFAEFDNLLSRAAEVPRTFGLAPPEASKETRKKFFDSMEDKQMGGVTFRLLLAWTIEHSKGKIAAQKAGKGYKK